MKIMIMYEEENGCLRIDSDYFRDLYVYPSSGEETVCHLSKNGLTYKLVFASGNFIFSRAKCVIASNDNSIISCGKCFKLALPLISMVIIIII